MLNFDIFGDSWGKRESSISNNFEMIPIGNKYFVVANSISDIFDVNSEDLIAFRDADELRMYFK